MTRWPEIFHSFVYFIDLFLFSFIQMLDTWHPLEKAQYPEYFARRDKRKEEYITRWEERYGKQADAISSK